MKKLLAVLGSLAICLSFAACGEKKDESSSKATESSSVVEASSEEIAEVVAQDSLDDADSEAAATGTYDSIQAFIDDNQESFEAYLDALEGTGMTMEIVSRGNSLVYSYKYTDETIENTEEMKSALETSMGTQEETFKTVLSSIQSVVPSAESIIVEYLDNAGEIIASFEFK